MAIYKLNELYSLPSTSIEVDKEFRGQEGVDYFRGTELSFKESPIKISPRILSENHRIQQKITRKGDILVQKIRYIKILCPEEKVLHNGSVINFRPSPNQNIKYLHILLLSLSNLMQEKYMYHGTKMPQLLTNSFMDYEVNIPSLEEQKEIIDIIEPKIDLVEKYSTLVDLSSPSSTRKSLNNLIDIIEPLERTETITNSLISFYKKFTTKVINLALKNQSNGKIHCTIKDLFSLPTTAIEINKDYRSTIGIDYFRGTELSFKESPIKIPNSILLKNPKIHSKLTQLGDVLVQKIRHIKILCPSKKVLHNGSVINFRPSNKENMKFLHLLLISMFDLMQNRYMYHGTKMPQLLVNSFLEHRICLPDKETQDNLGLIADEMEKLGELSEKINKQKALLAKYLIS